MFTFCEPVHATAQTREHIREVETKQYWSGGIPLTEAVPLCGQGRMAWDLARIVREDTIDPLAPVGPTCGACITLWREKCPA